jgi:hypothetical protein
MKIRVNDTIAVEIKITPKNYTTREYLTGGYYNIDYLIGGICIHNAATGYISSGEPNPIAMLDQPYTIREYHYQDISNPDPQPTDGIMYGKTISVGSVAGRPCWWAERDVTHRAAIIAAVSQIIAE